MVWRRLGWVMVAGLAPISGCGDDLPDQYDASTSGLPSTTTGEEPPASTSTSAADSTSTGALDTTQGVSATDTDTSEGSSSSSGTTGGTTGGTTSGTTDTGESSSTTSTPEPPQEPIVRDDMACMVRQQSSLLVDTLANDFDPQGSPLAVVDHDAHSVEGGDVAQVGDLLLYTPAPGFWGEDSFHYTSSDPQGHEAIGQARVMVWPGSIGASELAAGNHGISISPDVPLGRLGWSLSGGGDLDGDGIDDVVVSAPFWNNGEGRIYVVLGQPDPTPVELSAVAAGQGGYVLQGDFGGEYMGWSVDVLGDLDGDGIDDLAVGTGWASANGNRAGRVIVVFSQAFGGTLLLSQVLGTDGYVIDGALPEDWAGWAVSGTGDMNGDGIGEVLVGAPQAPDLLPGGTGHAYVVFGKGDALPVSLAGVLAGSGEGFAMLGQAGDHVGYSAVGLPDLDGDGRAEIMVGSEIAAGGAGRAYVVRGQPDPSPVSLSAVMGEVGGYGFEGSGPGIALGRSADGIGDLDGDGVPELMVGAPGPALAGDAVVHVLAGSNASSMVLGVPPPSQGGTIDGVQFGDNLGWSVASLPDWNGDGLADLALGAPSAGGDFGPGAVYVVFGRPDMTNLDLGAIALGRGGFVVTGEDWDDDAGFRVASAGDFDGDGASDLLLGAPQSEVLGNFSGRAYVVLGIAASTPELGACIPD